MTPKQLEKYAILLTKYCINAKKGEHILIRSTYLAEPLLIELQKQILNAGAYPELSISLPNQSATFYKYASNQVLDTLSKTDQIRAQYDALITIDAPYSLKELRNIPPKKIARRQKAYTELKTKLKKLGATGKLRWALCDYPTAAAAKEAGMSLSDYSQFIAKACFLTTKDPIAKWKELGKSQQKIVDLLNTKSIFRYKSPHMDITFSTANRTWINSDGKRNMPSGEVFTSPVEDSVNGHIRFTYPIYYLGQEIKNVQFKVKNGVIQTATASKGQALLDELLKTPGARQFGEVAIGNNPNITHHTKNILFDEKMGGTIHMAIGSSYPETGGKNHSAVHLDLIADMTKGEIWADNALIYENGQFR